MGKNQAKNKAAGLNKREPGTNPFDQDCGHQRDPDSESQAVGITVMESPSLSQNQPGNKIQIRKGGPKGD